MQETHLCMISACPNHQPLRADAQVKALTVESSDSFWSKGDVDLSSSSSSLVEKNLVLTSKGQPAMACHGLPCRSLSSFLAPYPEDVETKHTTGTVTGTLVRRDLWGSVCCDFACHGRIDLSEISLYTHHGSMESCMKPLSRSCKSVNSELCSRNAPNLCQVSWLEHSGRSC